MRTLGLVACLLTVACSGKRAGDDGGASADGPSSTPRFTGKTIEGEYLQLEDFRGQVVLLNIWATWCGPCRKELPELQALQETYGKRGFTVVGVSIDKEPAFGEVKRMVRRFGLKYPMIFDPGGSAVTTFDVTGYPTSLLLGKRGNTRWRRDGLIRPHDPEVDGQIQAALSAS